MANYVLSYFPCLLIFFVLEQEMINVWLSEAKENASTINFKDKKEAKVGYIRFFFIFWQQFLYYYRNANTTSVTCKMGIFRDFIKSFIFKILIYEKGTRSPF